MTLLYPRMKRRLGLTACRLVLESRVTAMTTKRVWEAGGGAGGVLETYARRRREWPLLNLSVIPRGTELAGVISILTNEWVVERNVMSFHDQRCLWRGITCLSVANLGRIINKSVCHSGRMHLLHYNSNMNNCFISYNGFFDVTNKPAVFAEDLDDAAHHTTTTHSWRHCTRVNHRCQSCSRKVRAERCGVKHSFLIVVLKFLPGWCKQGCVVAIVMYSLKRTVLSFFNL